MAGRNPIPAEIHFLKGNPSELSKKELKEISSSGLEPMTDYTPPPHLTDFQKKIWKELCARFGAVKILSVMDSLALEMLIDDYSEWREHAEYLDKNGYTIYETKTNGETAEKADPRNALKHNAHQRCVNLLIQFGWTPAARTKVRAMGPLEQDPLYGGLGKRPKK